MSAPADVPCRCLIAEPDPFIASLLLRFAEGSGLACVQAQASDLRVCMLVLRYDAARLHPVRVRPSNVAEIFSGCDVLVEAFDTAEDKAMLVETALSALYKTIVVAASGLHGSFKVNALRCEMMTVNTPAGAPSAGVSSSSIAPASSRAAGIRIRGRVDSRR